MKKTPQRWNANGVLVWKSYPPLPGHRIHDGLTWKGGCRYGSTLAYDQKVTGH